MKRGWLIFLAVGLAVSTGWHLMAYLSLVGVVSIDRFQDITRREVGFLDLAFLLVMLYMIFGKAAFRQARLVFAALTISFAVGLVLRMTDFTGDAAFFLIRSSTLFLAMLAIIVLMVTGYASPVPTESEK